MYRVKRILELPFLRALIPRIGKTWPSTPTLFDELTLARGTYRPGPRRRRRQRQRLLSHEIPGSGRTDGAGSNVRFVATISGGVRTLCMLSIQRLEVYQRAIEFLALVDDIANDLPKGQAERRDQLVRGGSRGKKYG